MAWGSTVPAARAALTTLLNAALDVRVRNGIGIGAAADKDALIIAYNAEDVPGVEGRYTVENYGANPLHDQYTIHCRILVAKGSSDVLKAEARAWALLAKVGATIAANPTLNSTVMLANPGAYMLIPSHPPTAGVLVALQFDVDIDSFTTV